MGETVTVKPAQDQKTNPLLFRAYKILKEYARATGAQICVNDQDNIPIPETYDDLLNEQTNICLYCIKYRIGAKIDTPGDLSRSPCTEVHTGAIKKARHFGGSYIYMCDLGFLFWTSPVYSEDRFIGSLVGSGFLGVDSRETVAQMYLMGKGTVSKTELKKKLSRFPRGESEKIKSLAELMLICAETLSTGDEDYHAVLKRRAEQQFSLSAEIRKLKNKYAEKTVSPVYPMDKERMLLAVLRRGDHEKGKTILNELLAYLVFSNPDRFTFIQCRAIEMVVLLSRILVSPAYSEDYLLETNNQYLIRIQETKNLEELTDALHIIVEHMAGQVRAFRGVRHAATLRKVERFIWENFSRKISLQEIADISGFSAPYFSTIFKEEMGENLCNYLNRLRVEKASYLLITTDLPLSEISGSCGFEDQSWFSKIFKSYTGMSPGKYRGQGWNAPDISRKNFSVDYGLPADPVF
jgi:AraC-like DNA-binding protein/ligand-binding sensor protein